jgi:hypothetical protein
LFGGACRKYPSQLTVAIYNHVPFGIRWFDIRRHAVSSRSLPLSGQLLISSEYPDIKCRSLARSGVLGNRERDGQGHLAVIGVPWLVRLAEA